MRKPSASPEPPRPRRRLWHALRLLAFALLFYAGFIVWLYGGDRVDMAQPVTEAFRSGGEATVTPLRANAFLLSGGGMNVVALIGADGVVLVDTASDWAAPKMAAALARITDLPVRHIINTHAHTDHRGGNGFFARGMAQIIAQTATAEKIREGLGGATTPADLPTLVFAKNHEFAFGDETVRVSHIADAHTQGDAVVQFLSADILVTGDIFVNEGLPFISEAVGATIDGYLRAQTEIIAMAGADTIIIPGHGPIADKARLGDVHDRLGRMRATVAFWKRLGLSQRLIVAAYPTYAWPLGWRDLGMSHKFFARLTYRTLATGP